MLVNPWSQWDHLGSVNRVKRQEQEERSEEILIFKQKTEGVKPSKIFRRRMKILEYYTQEPPLAWTEGQRQCEME